MPDKRPDPDKLLKRVQAEEKHEKRGKLKIYLGAAPGVGKTHEMLTDALEERKNGLDVVVGVAESHGRSEIDSKLKDFEILPKQKIEYHNKQLVEFDLDGALKRHPVLILMDEMAHTNVPGARHKKRWQDIKELLDRGINVYTTLNVQHIESLNNDVSQIINAPINETVPDSMIELAETIEVVDLSPEDLLKRLHEGKVYIPEQAALATEHYFRKGNLAALRELALRITANRVGVQVLLYRQDQGIRHIWPSREKILVCVGSRAESSHLIRTAKRMATSLQAEWIAVYVNKPQLNVSIERRNLAMHNLRLAEQLGAQTRILTGSDIVSEIMDFAREQNVTQIMVWKHIRSRWRNLFFPTLADEIVRYSGEIDVYVMTGSLDHRPPVPLPKYKHVVTWRRYWDALAVVVLSTALNYALCPYMKPSSLVMVYLLGVTFVALMGRMGPSIMASILSVLAFDFFFISPYYSFAVPDKENVFTMVTMLIISQVISYLTIMSRRQTEVARFAEHQSSVLYTLSRKLSSTRGTTKLLNTGINYIADKFDCEVLALLRTNSHLEISAKCRTNQELNDKEYAVAQWVYELGQKAGLGTDSLSFSDALYLPLLGAKGVIGVLRLHPIQPNSFSSPEQIHLLEACANQIALALEVDRLAGVH